MKQLVLFFCTLSLALSSFGFERDYVQRAKLTGPEEKVVIELAIKQGIDKVAKISTFNMYPTAARGIRVQGVEQVKEREVSYKVLNVNYNKWFHPGSGPRKGDVRMGDFWAGKPHTRKQTILRVGKTDYRCNAVQGLSIKEAASMFGLFLEGKFNVGPGVNKRSLGQVDWNKPSRFSKRGDRISVGFPHKNAGEGFFDMEIQLEGGKLTIQQMFQAIP